LADRSFIMVFTGMTCVSRLFLKNINNNNWRFMMCFF
jgi:hypothetical protein